MPWRNGNKKEYASSNQGVVFWFTGLAGAGKTTIAHLVYQAIKKKRRHVVFLDGDILRVTLDTELNRHGREDRLQIAYRNARLCKMLADQGIYVVCATISLFYEVQEWNRTHQPNYQEILIQAPMNVLLERDQKGIYSGVSNGTFSDVVGMDITPEFPRNPDIIVENDGRYQPEAWARMILKKLAARQVL